MVIRRWPPIVIIAGALIVFARVKERVGRSASLSACYRRINVFSASKIFCRIFWIVDGILVSLTREREFILSFVRLSLLDIPRFRVRNWYEGILRGEFYYILSISEKNISISFNYISKSEGIRFIDKQLILLIPFNKFSWAIEKSAYYA